MMEGLEVSNFNPRGVQARGHLGCVCASEHRILRVEYLTEETPSWNDGERSPYVPGQHT